MDEQEYCEIMEHDRRLLMDALGNLIDALMDPKAALNTHQRETLDAAIDTMQDVWQREQAALAALDGEDR